MAEIRTTYTLGVDSFQRDAQLWGLGRRQAFVLAAIPVFIVAGMVATIPFFDLFVWITAEDSLVEWAQFLMLFLSGLLFAWTGIEQVRRKVWIGVLFLCVALAIFFIAGEEIAWGQRIFGWATPEELEAINTQGETTVHNISQAHALFINAVMLAGLYGSLAPLVLNAVENSRKRSDLHYLLVPPMSLIPAFFMPFGYRLSRMLFPLESWFPHYIFPITKFSEVTELCFYFGLLCFAWLNLRRLHQNQRF